METDPNPTDPNPPNPTHPTNPTARPEPPSVTPSTPSRSARTALFGAAVALALVVTFTAGMGVGRIVGPSDPAPGRTPDPAASPGSLPTEYSLIKEAWDTLHSQYVGKDELDDRALIYGAIEGLTEAVGDTGHTDFMTPQERADRTDALSGSYVGIGVRIDPNDEGLPRIVGVFEGGPAEAAGVEVDEVIVEVDGKPTAGEAIDTVAGWVRGAASPTVELTLRRLDGTLRTLSIVRADVPIQPVSWALVPGTTVALIRLEQFSSGAADEMVKALEAARAAGAERIVLDLRSNPGGYVNEAVGIASQFLTGGLVYVERNAAGEQEEHPVSEGGVATDLPLVVLVNSGTASSSEIVAGALQDAGRAKIMGETTYGTGTVLSEYVLSDGSALRVGTVEWLTPDGRRIWHAGIAPDVPVSMADGAVPLTPDDIRRLTADEAADVGDTQIARALEFVATQAIARR